MLLKKKLATASALAVLLGLTACATPGETPDEGAPGSDSESSAIEVVPEIADMLPEDIKKSGVLKIGALGTNFPEQYTTEAGEHTGSIVKLYTAAAQVLGLEPQFDIVTNDAIQAGVESGRYDIAQMADNPERQKLFDIISVQLSGVGLAAHADNENDSVNMDEALCGSSVAVTKTSIAERTAIAVSEKCEAAGKEPAAISSFVDNAAVMLAISSEQAEYGIVSTGVANGYMARQPESIKVVDADYSFSGGPAVLKGRDELRDALQAALLHLVEIGLYDEILAEFGLEDHAIPSIPINNMETGKRRE
ncbi:MULTISPECIES: transporter substrate-binding domain-containing protein [unclassified Cryobacterium]|uniref:transporter substrate-binding domain-containing protein n=1 Tax=unclassified Cryobacterium TaxID=2649013 RepID=UPI0014452E3D|nr:MULTISPECIES: transporter substrate-binding domain-containing protein [unclassified Cryobacterium]